MDIKEIRQFIDEEFKKLTKPCGENYRKLMEKVLQARFNIFDFISKDVPHEVKTGINLGVMNSETPNSREFDINLNNFKEFSCSIQNNSLSLHIKL